MERMKIYKTTLQIRTVDCDLTSCWKPSAILETMQEAATSHSVFLNISRNDLFPKGLVWVVTRNEVEMDRYPVMGETISIETMPMPVRRWFFPRYYIFRDAEGNQIGKAGSVWVLLDVNSRHMASPDAVLELMPDNSDLTAPMGFPATVRAVEGSAREEIYVPSYSDFDLNQHVNNTRYLDWACNALGTEIMRTHSMSHFTVNYNQEIRLGEEVRTVLHQNETAFSFAGIGDAGNYRFDICGELKARE